MVLTQSALAIATCALGVSVAYIRLRSAIVLPDAFDERFPLALRTDLFVLIFVVIATA